MYAGIEMVNAPVLNTTATAGKNRRMTAYPPCEYLRTGFKRLNVERPHGETQESAPALDLNTLPRPKSADGFHIAGVPSFRDRLGVGHRRTYHKQNSQNGCSAAPNDAAAIEVSIGMRIVPVGYVCGLLFIFSVASLCSPLKCVLPKTKNVRPAVSGTRPEP